MTPLEIWHDRLRSRSAHFHATTDIFATEPYWGLDSQITQPFMRLPWGPQEFQLFQRPYHDRIVCGCSLFQLVEAVYVVEHPRVFELASPDENRQCGALIP